MQKQHKIDLFREIVPSITRTKQDVFTGIDDEYTSYNAFLINRALSYHYDCVGMANFMNTRPALDKKMQYAFLLNIIRPRYRPFEKWTKPGLESDLECVKEYFGYSDIKAQEALKILSPSQIEAIRTKTDKGGMRKR
jgi:hypothetical protein